MKPLHKFGDCNQYGFDVTDQLQLNIMKLEPYASKKDKFGDPEARWIGTEMDSTIQEEINRNGGFDALIEMLCAIKRSQTPGKPYKTSTQKMEEEKRKLVVMEKARNAKALKAQERKEAAEEEKNEKIREATARRMAKNEAKRKLRAKKASEGLEKEAQTEIAKEDTEAKAKSKAAKKKKK